MSRVYYKTVARCMTEQAQLYNVHAKTPVAECKSDIGDQIERLIACQETKLYKLGFCYKYATVVCQNTKKNVACTTHGAILDI